MSNEDNDVNQRVHDMLRNDWIRLSNTLLLLLIGLVVSATSWQITRMASKQDAIIQASTSDHERINNIQTAQVLISKLVDQLRQDVARHDYQIETMRQTMRDNAAKQRPDK